MRGLRIEFASPEDFEREYNANLANAGVFVATEESFELRETLQVDLSLAFADRAVSLDGEVVHVVTPAMLGAGGRPGVAVQFSMPAHEVREQLSPLIEASGSFQAEPSDTGTRAAPRVPARVAVTLSTPEGPVEGRTRNLSRTGVLVEAPCGELPLGTELSLLLFHPVTARSMSVAGRVTRQVRNAGEVTGLGIEFAPQPHEEADFHAFVEEIQSAEHSRLLGAISGSLTEIGPQNLLQMFATSAQVGTLRLVQGESEGLIGFERGLLRYARLGTASGMKALTRLLAWNEGGFEFHSRLEPMELPEPPLPLEAAVLEALQQIDELGRVDSGRFPPHARLRVLGSHETSDGKPSKVEEAVVDLARAGFRVQRIVEVIPESDPEIYRAIASLVDRGVVACDD